jgi:hypothetical protein
MRAHQIKQLVCAGGRPVIPDTIPEMLKSIIIACWAHDPRARPTFAALLPYLEESLQQSLPHGMTETTMVTREGDEEEEAKWHS